MYVFDLKETKEER